MNPDCLRGFGKKLSKPKKPNKKDMLIAAAPDLLAACQELIAELDNRESQYGYPDTGGMILARMAIQKAGAE